MKPIFLLVLTGLVFQAGFSQKSTEMDFKSVFDQYGVDGCFVLYNQTDNEYIRYRSDLCDTGYIPASTFKIPHSIMALEEGIIKDTNQVIKWDGHEWPNKPWNQDQTLKTAMKYSCIWVYVGFAGQIELKKYQDYVNSFQYGNQNLAGPPTRFWLAGSFRISANQQIDFLRRFYNYELPNISRRSIDIVKDLIVIEQTSNYRFCGKTGGGMLTDTDYIMWLVGYLEQNNHVYFYAMNFKSDDYDKTSIARYSITKDILRELKLLE
ncbi:MAG: class D beta-lactamase [Prolixibacteraceae bacterium]|nr:class D beta-lactamase [Prolixibacteraceae bacterium]